MRSIELVDNDIEVNLIQPRIRKFNVKALIVMIALASLAHCGSDPEAVGKDYTKGPAKHFAVPCEVPPAYFHADGTPYTDCAELNFCANPAEVFDADGNAYNCNQTM